MECAWRSGRGSCTSETLCFVSLKGKKTLVQPVLPWQVLLQLCLQRASLTEPSNCHQTLKPPGLGLA